MKFQICLLLISLALCASTYRVGPPQARIDFESLRREVDRYLASLGRTLLSGEVLSENQYRLMRNKIQNLSVMLRNRELNMYQMILKQMSYMLENTFEISRQIEVPLVGRFVRYKSVGEYQVFKLFGWEQHYNPNATLYVTIEKKGDGIYKETWNRDGYIHHFTTVHINNGEELHQTHADGRESKLKPSELFEGWYETENDGIKSHHRRIYLIRLNDEFVSRHIYIKDGKHFNFTEYFRRV